MASKEEIKEFFQELENAACELSVAGDNINSEGGDGYSLAEDGQGCDAYACVEECMVQIADAQGALDRLKELVETRAAEIWEVR